VNGPIPQTAGVFQVCGGDDDGGIRGNKQEEQEKSGEQPCH